MTNKIDLPSETKRKIRDAVIEGFNAALESAIVKERINDETFGPDDLTVAVRNARINDDGELEIRVVVNDEKDLIFKF